jgi:hypothetical protein
MSEVLVGTLSWGQARIRWDGGARVTTSTSRTKKNRGMPQGMPLLASKRVIHQENQAKGKGYDSLA